MRHDFDWPMSGHNNPIEFDMVVRKLQRNAPELTPIRNGVQGDGFTITIDGGSCKGWMVGSPSDNNYITQNWERLCQLW